MRKKTIGRKTSRDRFLLGAIFLTGLGFMAGCGDVAEIDAVRPKRGTIVESFSEPARTQLSKTYRVTMPIQGRIDARTLSEAIEKFPETIQSAIEAMMDEAREAQRQEASRIVVPGAQATSQILTGPDLKK